MKTKTQKVKAEATWIDGGWDPNEPVWELPRTAEAYDAMAEQIARSLERNDWQATYAKDAKVALRAIGITRPKETT